MQLRDSARPCEGVPRKVPVTYITKLEAVPSLYRQPKE